MGLSPDAIDRIWRSYEPDLPGAISAIEQNCYDNCHWAVICLHLAAQGVRHPDFIRLAREHLLAQGAAASDADLPQLQRVKTMEDGFEVLVQTAKFAVVGRIPESRRFILNDKGYIKLADYQTKRTGIFFPLSSSTMVLAVLDATASGRWSRSRPTRRLTLTREGVQMLNEASWRQEGISFVVGHPDDASWIAQLDDLTTLIEPRLGPYRGINEGFFDWASP